MEDLRNQLAPSTFGKQPTSSIRSANAYSFGAGKEFGAPEQPQPRRQPTALLRSPLRKGEREPGVGAHQAPPQFGKQRLSHNRNARSFQFGRDQPPDERRARILQAYKEKCVEGPGPGAYSLAADDKLRHRGSHGQAWNELPQPSERIDESRRRNPEPPAPGVHDAAGARARTLANAPDQELASSTLGRNKKFPTKRYAPAYGFGQGYGQPVHAGEAARARETAEGAARLFEAKSRKARNAAAPQDEGEGEGGGEGVDLDLDAAMAAAQARVLLARCHAE
eukprot:g7843.t1